MLKINPDNITNIIVTGKSGAGKQPRIDVLVDELNLEQLSTGDIFRNYLGKFNNYGYNDSLESFFDNAKNCFIFFDKNRHAISDNIELKYKNNILEAQL